MKDILLVGFFSKNESPYMELYKEIIKKEGASVEVLYFERYGKEYSTTSDEICFCEYCPTGGKKSKKIWIMMKYAFFLRKQIREKKYKGMVVFATVPAIMIPELLIKKFSNRFILDIRDYTHERNKLYYHIEKNLIKHAFCTIISSRGFRDFLPDNTDYIISHNVPISYTTSNIAFNATKKTYTIGFVGSIRYYAENCELIDKLSKSNKYKLAYYGTHTLGCNLEEYCRTNDRDNVSFKGKFNNNEKRNIYESVDIINSIYSIDNYETNTALPNRLYDACIYRKPIIVSKGTYLSELVEQYNLGISIDVFNDNIEEKIDAYIARYDRELFIRSCNSFLAVVDEDIDLQKKKIAEFVKTLRRS